MYVTWILTQSSIHKNSVKNLILLHKILFFKNSKWQFIFYFIFYDFYYIRMQNFQRLIWKTDKLVHKIKYAIIKLKSKPFYASAPIFEKKNSHCIVNWWLIIICYTNFIHMSDFTWILALNKIYCSQYLHQYYLWAVLFPIISINIYNK